LSLPITFRNSELERQWDTSPRRHPMLVTVVEDLCTAVYDEFGWLPLVTSFIRTKEEDDELGGSGIHVEGRALDFRTRGIPKTVVDWAVSYVNGKYQYDPERPALPVAYAKPHGNGPHLHLQVHNRTVLRQMFRAAAND